MYIDTSFVNFACLATELLKIKVRICQFGSHSDMQIRRSKTKHLAWGKSMYFRCPKDGKNTDN